MEQSLRTTLRDWERTNDLHYVDRVVDPRFELGAVLSLRKDGPTQFFRRVKGYDMPVVGNVLNTREKIARGLGVELHALQDACIDALDQGIEPLFVPEGPVQEVVHQQRVDIPSLLPVPTWFEREGGAYITAGVVIAKDPETGLRNVSIARLRVEGGDRLLAGIAPTHHLSELIRRAEAQGRDLEVAVAIGNHPAVLIASQMYVELGHDEYDIAGALLGEPLRLVRCRTVDLEVPAEAEIVLEGVLGPTDRIEEGPVSEFPGFYVNYGAGHAVRVRAVSHRRDAIYQAILPGYAPEHCLLGGIAIGATSCQALRRAMPNVQRVFITDGGMGRLHAIITMHRPKPGEARRAITLAMGQVNLLKLVIVVDDDIDPEDWSQVEWALATRMRAERDIVVFPGARADRCEPLEENLTVTKVGIVATSLPGDGDPGGRFELARPPREVLERVQRELGAY
ncbi:MAG TPA: UbiD family decarboxylase [Anaerolineae bacterium]|jgi:UbiD family decarboxylase|nr:UbiD family decarboxylase [Anaerolineae bacterium]